MDALILVANEQLSADTRERIRVVRELLESSVLKKHIQEYVSGADSIRF